VRLLAVGSAAGWALGILSTRVLASIVYEATPRERQTRACSPFAGRGLTASAIAATVAGGIPNTAMPAFGEPMKPDMGHRRIHRQSRPRLGFSRFQRHTRPAAQIEQDRAIFFDAARPGARGSCHGIAGRAYRQRRTRRFAQGPPHRSAYDRNTQRGYRPPRRRAAVSRARRGEVFVAPSRPTTSPRGYQSFAR